MAKYVEVLMEEVLVDLYFRHYCTCKSLFPEMKISFNGSTRKHEIMQFNRTLEETLSKLQKHCAKLTCSSYEKYLLKKFIPYSSNINDIISLIEATKPTKYYSNTYFRCYTQACTSTQLIRQKWNIDYDVTSIFKPYDATIF